MIAYFRTPSDVKTDNKNGEYRKGPTQAELQELVNNRGPKVTSNDEPNKM